MGDDAGHESEQERLNRELDQLLEEVRVALPGVQVLLAFLLTVPFAQRFTEIDGDSRDAYLTAVVLAAVASVLLIAPTVHHRMRFRDGVKDQLVRTANVLVLAGATSLGLAIGAATYVVGDSAFPDTPARLIGPGVVVLAGLVWYVLPMRYRQGAGRRGRGPSGDDGS
jgi:hypothetical protein